MSDLNANFLDQMAGEGLDAFKASDLPKPFIKIAQKGSPETDERDPEYITGLKQGMFFNSLTKEVYGDNINVVVVGYENAWLVYGDHAGEFKGKFQPGTLRTMGSPFAKDKKDKVKVNDPDHEELFGCSVVDSMVFYVLNADKPQDGIAILTLYSGNIKHAQNWVFAILHSVNASGRPMPIFGYVWNLQLSYNSDNGNTWFALGVKNKTSVQKALIDDGSGNMVPRQITEEIYTRYVKPSRQLFISGAVKANYSLLEDKTGSATNADMTQY